MNQNRPNVMNLTLRRADSNNSEQFRANRVPVKRAKDIYWSMSFMPRTNPGRQIHIRVTPEVWDFLDKKRDELGLATISATVIVVISQQRMLESKR